MITITVSPSMTAKGQRAYSTRGQLFDVAAGGRPLASKSPQPFLDAARALLADGAHPAIPIVMCHRGQADYALRSTVGTAAGLTVKDTPVGRPAFRQWQSYNGEPMCPVSPPMRQIEEAATLVAN